MFSSLIFLIFVPFSLIISLTLKDLCSHFNSFDLGDWFQSTYAPSTRFESQIDVSMECYSGRHTKTLSKGHWIELKDILWSKRIMKRKTLLNLIWGKYSCLGGAFEMPIQVSVLGWLKPNLAVVPATLPLSYTPKYNCIDNFKDCWLPYSYLRMSLFLWNFCCLVVVFNHKS